MNTFDSVTLLAPVQRSQINLDEFYACNERKTKYKLKEVHQRPGINAITYNAETSNLYLDFTSKLLGKDYFQMINENNIDQYYHLLTSTGIFDCTPYNFLTSKVLGCDVAQDVQHNNISSLIGALRTYSSTKYRVGNSYSQSGCNTSTQFIRICKTKKTHKRAIVYDKLNELRSKENKPFFSSLSAADQAQLCTQATNKVRVEGNFYTFEKIRKYLSVQENTLVQVLQSKGKALHMLMKEIIDASPQTTSHISCDPSSVSIKELPLYYTLLLFKFNMDVIREQYKAKESKNLSRNIKAIENLYARLRSSQEVNFVQNLLDQLEN